jgi:hypothetical protein
MERDISNFHHSLLLVSLWPNRKCDLSPNLPRLQDEVQGMSHGDER